MNFSRRAGNDGTSRPDDGIRRLGRRADGGRAGQPRDEFIEAFRRQLAARFSTTPRTATPVIHPVVDPVVPPVIPPVTPPAIEDPPADTETEPRPAPEVWMPDLRAPEVRAPEVTTPEIKRPEVRAPQFEAPPFEAPPFEAPQFASPPPKPEVERKRAPTARLPRPALLVHSFFLGAALATALCLYFLDRTEPPPPAPTAAATAATAAAVATVPSPPPPAVPSDRLVAAAPPPAEAPPIRREPPPAATVPDHVRPTIDRETGNREMGNREVGNREAGNREAGDGDRALTAGDIREIQTRLLLLGLKPGPVDGVAGRQTTAAIQGYLQSRGQAMPARVDRALLERLRQETRGR